MEVRTLRNSYEDYKMLLGELQLSYLILLLGFNYDGFEQWKSITTLICLSEEAIEKYPDLYCDFVQVLYSQLSDGMDNVLDDLVGSNQNFLVECLQFFSESSKCTSNQTLKKRSLKLFEMLKEKYSWEFDDVPEAEFDLN
jgi:A1 cistron-splicing factor AAR2